MIKEPVRHCAMEMESRMRQGTRHRKLPLTVSRCEEGEGEPCHRGGTAFQVGHRSPGGSTVAGWRNREQAHVAGVRVGVSRTGELRKNSVGGR